MYDQKYKQHYDHNFSLASVRELHLVLSVTKTGLKTCTVLGVLYCFIVPRLRSSRFFSALTPPL